MKQLLRRILAATTLAATLLVFAFVVAFAVPAAAQLNGTIKTTDQFGNVNHGGHFATKDDVT